MTVINLFAGNKDFLSSQHLSAVQQECWSQYWYLLCSN